MKRLYLRGLPGSAPALLHLRKKSSISSSTVPMRSNLSVYHDIPHNQCNSIQLSFAGACVYTCGCEICVRTFCMLRSSCRTMIGICCVSRSPQTFSCFDAAHRSSLSCRYERTRATERGSSAIRSDIRTLAIARWMDGWMEGMHGNAYVGFRSIGSERALELHAHATVLVDIGSLWRHVECQLRLAWQLGSPSTNARVRERERARAHTRSRTASLTLELRSLDTAAPTVCCKCPG